MDEIVIRGMAKWPNVPSVFGWLTLDRRGDWLLKGERIWNPGIANFIGRNYECDEQGRWYFQNGPQRVYVTLEYAPLVYRVTCTSGHASVLDTQRGKQVSAVKVAWMDEHGSMLLETSDGVGLVHDHDMGDVLARFVDVNGEKLNDDQLEQRVNAVRGGAETDLFLDFGGPLITVMPIASRHVAAKFGFVSVPRACDAD